MSLNPVGNVTDSVYNRYGKASSAKTSTKAEETAKAESSVRGNISEATVSTSISMLMRRV